jgi:hypothetical protein
MPILRGPDGQIIDDKTENVALGDQRPPSRDDAEPPTDPLARRPARDEESLFKAVRPTTDRLEAPTPPMRSKEQSDAARTRVLHRRTRQTPAPLSVGAQDDPRHDPPVGWLVIVGGPGQGHALPLGTGMNSIGRAADARVRVDFGDDGISRSDHARLAYDPRRRLFHLSHGAGANLTYLNGEVVMAPMKIESGGTIEIGATTLRFQAFCSKEFDWADVDD